MAKNDHVHEESLTATIDSLNKKFGEGTILDGVVAVEAISTGIPTLDSALGVGGLPRGRVVEIYGTEASGKTTTALQVAASVQKTFIKDRNRYGVVAYIDVEHALDPTWATAIGVNMNKVVFSQPSSGDEAIAVAKALVNSGGIDLIVVDSVASLTPLAEINAEEGDVVIGAQAKLMSQGLRKISPAVGNANSISIFINQIRMKIGQQFGSPETTPGGVALKFYASVRMELRRSEPIREGNDSSPIIGNVVKCKIVKNKVAPPFRNAVFDIYYGKPPQKMVRPIYGVDYCPALIEAAIERKVMAVSGSWYAFKGEKIGNGLVNAAATLRACPELVEMVRVALYKAMEPEHPKLDGESDESVARISKKGKT